MLGVLPSGLVRPNELFSEDLKGDRLLGCHLHSGPLVVPVLNGVDILLEQPARILSGLASAGEAFARLRQLTSIGRSQPHVALFAGHGGPKPEDPRAAPARVYVEAETAPIAELVTRPGLHDLGCR